jgi:hypothetical protein
MLPGCQAPIAEARGDATADSPLLTDAAAVRAALNSRRPAVSAAKASGADGSAPLPPVRNGGRALTRFTDPDTDAARATVEEPVPAKPARTTERDGLRGRADDCACDGSDDLDDTTLDPVAVSAAATGIDAIVAPTPTPTPSATANAPTRPTYRAHLCADGIVSNDSTDRTGDTGTSTELIATFLQNRS